MFYRTESLKNRVFLTFSSNAMYTIFPVAWRYSSRKTRKTAEFAPRVHNLVHQKVNQISFYDFGSKSSIFGLFF